MSINYILINIFKTILKCLNYVQKLGGRWWGEVKDEFSYPLLPYLSKKSG
jgi:hypothetical protein